MTTISDSDDGSAPGAPVDAPAGVSVVEWRRYGHHRAYAALPDGTKLGFRCLATGTDHPADPTYAAALGRAVDAWAALGATAPVDTVLPVAPPAATVTTTVRPADPGSPTSTVPETVEIRPVAAPAPWTDLSLNEPGSNPRALARERRRAGPSRSNLARALGVHTQERAWRVGARGEQLVAVELAQLLRRDPRWRVLHSIPVGQGGADIDHLVIGPGGVFTLSAAHHAGKRMWVGGDTVTVNGQRVPYVRNARHEARRATRLLALATGVEVEVTGVVVPVKLVELVVETPPSDVVVLHRHAVGGWLRQRPQALTDAEVAVLHDHARRSSTWAR